MGAGNFTVLYDACVLYPAPLRDLFVRLASKRIFRAKWTEKIHAEWINALIEKRPALDAEKLQRTASLMNKAVPDCLVTGYEPLINSLELPDPDDRHVLAAAIKSQAEVIVTFNQKDFPEDYLQTFDIWIQHPDEFMGHLIDLHPDVVLAAAREQKAALMNPPVNTNDFIDAILRQQLPATASFLKEHKHLLE